MVSCVSFMHIPNIRAVHQTLISEYGNSLQNWAARRERHGTMKWPEKHQTSTAAVWRRPVSSIGNEGADYLVSSITRPPTTSLVWRNLVLWNAKYLPYLFAISNDSIFWRRTKSLAFHSPNRGGLIPMSVTDLHSINRCHPSVGIRQHNNTCCFIDVFVTSM